MNIWIGLHWECLQGLLLDGTYTAGTVKLFDYWRVDMDSGLDFEILKEPKFWQYHNTANAWMHSSEGNVAVPVHNASNSFHSLDSPHSLDPATNVGNSVSDSLRASRRLTQTQCRARTIQHKRTSIEASQQQLLLAKQIQQLAAKGEQCYLALVFPHHMQKSSINQQQGMTQRVEREMMKAMGPIRKPPPLEETCRKYYLSVPHSV